MATSGLEKALARAEESDEDRMAATLLRAQLQQSCEGADSDG